MAVDTLFCSICDRLAIITIIIAPNWPRVEGRVGLGDRKLYQSKCRHCIPIRLLCTLQTYLAPFVHNTQRDRWQTDRTIGIGRPCYGIVGLMSDIGDCRGRIFDCAVGKQSEQSSFSSNAPFCRSTSINLHLSNFRGQGSKLEILLSDFLINCKNYHVEVRFMHSYCNTIRCAIIVMLHNEEVE